MKAFEIENLLEGAGYHFDAIDGRYSLADDTEDAEDFVTEDVAMQLQIPIADLLAWEETQSNAGE